jgi:hypothetical protein
MDFSYVTAQDTVEGDGDLKSLIGSEKLQNKRHLPPIWSEVEILLYLVVNVSVSPENESTTVLSRALHNTLLF